jgi:hypothetical protein
VLDLDELVCTACCMLFYLVLSAQLPASSSAG